MTLIPDVQGLGRLDVELIKETERLKSKSKIYRKTRLKHLTLSKLWILGAYELVRLMREITQKPNSLVSEKIKTEIFNTKKEFEKIRIPLTKFQMPNRQKPKKKNRLFGQFPDSFLDSSGEVGWKVYTTIERRPIEIYYRRTFGDLLLRLLEFIDKEIRSSLISFR